MYCATCILHWALHKEEPWCPQCKNPFSYLLTYRTLDGTLQVRQGRRLGQLKEEGDLQLRVCLPVLLLLLPCSASG